MIALMLRHNVVYGTAKVNDKMLLEWDDYIEASMQISLIILAKRVSN
jgi:hypothetical protein